MEFPLHSQQLLSALRIQRQQGFLCDCTVLVGSSHFVAHRAVLASCSPFFHMFFSDSPGSNGLNITLDNDIVTADAFGSLLDFIYEGVLQSEKSVPVEDVLAAASFLHMNGVVKLCRKRLQTRGPVAEADSTRSEGGAAVNVVSQMEKSCVAASGAQQMETPSTNILPHCGSSGTEVKTPPSRDVADTTQPCTESSPLLPIIELVRGQSAGQPRLRTEGLAEVPVLCSPCSTTESYCSQQPSSSSLLPPSFSSCQPTVTVTESESQKEHRDLLQSLSQASLPSNRIQRRESPKSNHTFPQFKTPDAQPEASGSVEVKEEAIVISDEELEEENEEGSYNETLIEEVEDSEEDLKEDETSNLQYLSFQERSLQMTSHSLSPSSSVVGLSSQDGSLPPVLLHSSSIATQSSGPSKFFQDLQEGESFVEDVPTCKVCCKTFSCSYTLRRHATVHTRQRPYECRYCYRSYTQSGDLYRHIRKVHDPTLPAKRSRSDITPQTTK
ncbi:zinc finger and BTB domain-containing protein 3 [Synchiropus splendidus]|uniref:zinc finger and BTB domain-containing protein 3 n=1 Tax=Synchiropus splendidus TaxID=270530 RepID=UPI00237E64BF|nr:zinc finger and BTB domain-containing protein 3 [Synchiropus splendidus]XP_053735801.1 zinc finger and BTB domain-containing protein 3 [Synchiropus splendidus]